VIPINSPSIGEEEIEAVIKVLRNGPLTNALGSGPMVTQFEKNFADYSGVKHAVAVNTGTAALHSAIVAAGVKNGDEVILPSFTFVATAEAVVMAGGKPVFADIDPLTYTISPAEIEKNVTKRTRCILPVDLYGYPADYDRINEIAEKRVLSVIEDAAQSHGATYNGKPAGCFADAACWSLYASKNMTTGEGGVVTTDSEEIDGLLRMVRTHGEKAKYSSQMLGYNYRMSEIQAAIGLVQLKKLPSFLKKRRENAQKLAKILVKTARLQLPGESKDRQHSWYLYTARLKNGRKNERDGLVEQLKKKGIGAEAYYVHPVHTMPYYQQYGNVRLPETEKASEQVFSLPVHPGVTEEQLNFIGESVLSLL
jgi:perosamine synthetase